MKTKKTDPAITQVTEFVDKDMKLLLTAFHHVQEYTQTANKHLKR